VLSSVSVNNYSNTGEETGFLRKEVMVRLKPMFSIVTFVLIYIGSLDKL